MKQTHILFIVENDGAPEDTRVWNEACTAKEYGYEVTVISPKTDQFSKSYEKIDGIKIFRHPELQGNDRKGFFIIEYLNALVWEFLFCLRIYRLKPFHVIHGANPPDHIFLIALFFKLFGVSYIFDHHDLSGEMYLAKFGGADFFYRILTLMERLSFKIADVVISTNASYKKIAMNRGGLNHSRVFVVRNGPDLSKIKFLSANNLLRNKFDYMVAYVGVIGRQEGIDNLLKSVDYIVNTVKLHNIKFVVVGKGPNWQEMVDLAHTMHISGFVEFTGYISDEKLYEVLATADLCVNPEFRNNFTDNSTMLKIMDYMTFGKPIVQFYTKEGELTAGGAAEYVYENNETAFAEKIINLLPENDKRQKMGAIGKKRIEKILCWEKQKPNLLNAYHCIEGLNENISTPFK